MGAINNNCLNVHNLPLAKNRKALANTKKSDPRVVLKNCAQILIGIQPQKPNQKNIVAEQLKLNTAPVLPKKEIAAPVLPKKEIAAPVLPKKEIAAPVLPKKEITAPVLPKKENTLKSASKVAFAGNFLSSPVGFAKLLETKLIHKALVDLEEQASPIDNLMRIRYEDFVENTQKPLLQSIFAKIAEETDLEQQSSQELEESSDIESNELDFSVESSDEDDFSSQLEMLDKMEMLLQTFSLEDDQEYSTEVDQISEEYELDIVAEELVESTEIDELSFENDKYAAQIDYTQNAENLSWEIARFKEWIETNSDQTFYSESFYKEHQELSALEGELNVDGSYFSLNQLVKRYEELVNRVNTEVSEIPLSANYGQMRIQFSRDVSNIRMEAEAGMKAAETQIKAIDVKITDVRSLMISRRSVIMDNMQGLNDVLAQLLNEKKTISDKYEIEFMHAEYASFIENLGTSIDDVKELLSGEIVVASWWDELKDLELDLARLAKGPIHRSYLETLEADFKELSNKVGAYFGIEN